MTEEEIRWKLGLDDSSMRRGTYAALDVQKKAAAEYVGFWTKAAAEKEAIELSAAKKTSMALIEIEREKNRVSIAMAKASAIEKAAVTTAWMEEQSAQIAMRHGSGAFGSLEKKGSGELVHGLEAGAAGAAGGAVIDSVARRELLVMTRELVSGNYKRFFSSFSIFVQHLGPAALAMAKVAAGFATIAATTYDLGKLLVVSQRAKDSSLGEAFSRSALASQTGALGGDLQSHIDDLEKSGQISSSTAKQLRAMTSGTTTSEKLRIAQRYIAKEETAEREKQAAADAKAADFVRASAVAAKDREESEKLTIEHQREGEEINNRLQSLWRERKTLQSDFNKIGQENPTIADLAGREYSKNLNSLYGDGGRFDLGAGDGPFAGVAQEYLLRQKQQTWDIIHGNAQFDSTGALVGGQAFYDKQRTNQLGNILGAAGQETPAMKIEIIKEHLGQINTNILNLYQKASTDGIVIADK